MLLTDYVSRNLTPPIPTKDGGTLRTIGEACEYMAAIGKEREQRRHWQQVRELMLQEADVAAVSWRVRLAVLKDAKVDVTALSEPMERWMDEPSSGFLSNGKLNVVEKDEPSTEPTEGNERSDSESEEELRRQEDFQQAACHRPCGEPSFVLVRPNLFPDILERIEGDCWISRFPVVGFAGIWA